MPKASKYVPSTNCRQLKAWTAGNGLVNHYAYNGNGQLTDIDVSGVQSQSFSYDNASRLTGITNGVHASLTQAFTYDALNRLTGVTSPSGNQSYQYDANGNRTLQVVDGVTTSLVIQTGSNRLASVGGQAIGYDANGNVVSKGGVTLYHYNSFNRLQSAGGATFTINPEGQRLRKTGPDGTTYFAPDRGGQLLADNPYGMWKDYVWMGGRMVSMITDNTVYALHSDQTGRVLAITGPNKAVVWEAEGLAFHRHTTAGSKTFFRMGFPGQYWDVEDNLWHNGFRDYNPVLGRYIESDPTGLNGGLNTYAYVGDNPINNIDSAGLMCFDFNKFADFIHDNKFDLVKVATTLGVTLGIGTMPKVPSELRGLGVPKAELNPYTSQLSRWSARLGTRSLRVLGRTPAGVAAGVTATGATIFEGFYDLSIEAQAAVKATSLSDCGCKKGQ